MITKLSGPYFSYSACNCSYCGVNPHFEATFTTNTFFPFSDESGKSLPSIDLTVKSSKFFCCADSESMPKQSMINKQIFFIMFDVYSYSKILIFYVNQ
ncbi:MAG: hypothetical protein LBV72_05080 [Tannerella sp.]|nr:hypothetical protein [Tannerella sp.]